MRAEVQGGFLRKNWLMLLLILVPVAAVLEISHASHTWIFLVSGLAIVPLAALMGRATEGLAHHLGAGMGGFLNATFGNAAELIIAVMALRRGLFDVVKASITGSIIGNILLVLGLSLLCGGLKYKQQRFNRTAASMGSTLLALAAVGLLIPAIYHWVTLGVPGAHERELSLEISVILFMTYLASLLFSLKTHQHLYLGENAEEVEAAAGHPAWPMRKSVFVLVGSTALIALMSEFLVGSVEQTALTFGLTPVFVGVIVVAIIGNAAEHSTAVLVALGNRMDLSLAIAVGSSYQVALFVAPLLVFTSYAFGTPMDLLFTPLEVLAVAISVATVALVSLDGESNWMEGVQLLAVYVILALAFFNLP